MGSASDTYDFIVVGAGPAGVITAVTLAQSSSRPSVLLLEAGGKNESSSIRADGDRFIHRMAEGMNWNYSTAPQDNLNSREIPYDHGKGLGGGSAINFSCWTVPPKDDFEYLSEITADEDWKWTSVQQYFKEIESFYGSKPHISDSMVDFIQPKPRDHGTNGPIKIGFPMVSEKHVLPEIDNWAASGYKKNKDHNSGDPLGIAICASTAFQGYRSTAADALFPTLTNLHIMTDAPVTRVLFSADKVATSVLTASGQTYYITKEIILSAGSLDTPRILMHSGIGPSSQLNAFSIPVIHHSPHVGQHLQDHFHAFLTHQRAESATSRYLYFRSKSAQNLAREQWERDHSGPLAEIGCTMGVVFGRLPTILNSPEFAALPETVKSHLNRPTVPSFEVLTSAITIGYLISPETYPPANTTFICVMNPQSQGTATLQSSDPAQPLLFDPKIFSHPYDRRVAVEATREALRVTSEPGYAKDTVGVLEGPKSDAEEDILNYWRETTGSTWHMTGTARIGKTEAENVEGSGGAVDVDLKVFGVTGLRVADMSVYPFLPCAHTQTTAYLVGKVAGKKIIREYGLDGRN